MSSLLPPPLGNLNILKPICFMCQRKLPDFLPPHNLLGAAREPVARFRAIIPWVSPPSASPATISGSSAGAHSVTFDYRLEGTEQGHNSLISNRWLRSSKGANRAGFVSACVSGAADWSKAGRAALTVRSARTSRLLRVSTDSCHIFASPGGALGLPIRGSHCHLISKRPWCQMKSAGAPDRAARMMTKQAILFVFTCFNTRVLPSTPASYTCLHHQQWFTAVNWQPVSLGFTSLSFPARRLWLNPYMTINTE